MNASRKTLIAVTAGSCLAATTAVAAPLETSHVPADAVWLAHVDIEAAMASGLIEVVEGMNGDINIGELDEFKAHTGLDPFTDLSGVTIFGTEHPDDEDPVVLVYGRGGSSKLIDLFQREMPEVRPQAIAGALEYSWEDDGTQMTLRLDADGAANDMPWTLAICEDADRCAVALETLRDGSGRVQASPAGSLLYVRAIGIDKMLEAAGDDAASAMLGAARTFQLSIGADDENVSIAARLGCSDADAANALYQGGMGLLGMGRFMLASEPEGAEILPLLDAIKFGVDGATITVDMEHPINEIGDMQQKIMDADLDNL